MTGGVQLPMIHLIRLLLVSHTVALFWSLISDVGVQLANLPANGSMRE